MDAKTLRLNEKSNYLNHPPVYYVFLGCLGPNIEGSPYALLYFRLLNVALSGVGLAVILWMGYWLCSKKLAFYAYSIPLFCIPVLMPLAGSINNDNAAFCGGCLAMAGLYRQLSESSPQGLALMLVGLLISGLAKLTGLLLTGTLIAAGLLYLAWHGRFRRAWIAPVIVTFLIAALPYVLLEIQYGSPAPNTVAQEAALRSGSAVMGWTKRLSFIPYVIHFLTQLIASWMPTLSPRGPLQFAMLALPLAAIGFSMSGIFMATRRLLHGIERPMDVVLLSGTLAFAVTFTCHIVFSYERHLATGWMMDAYFRYYLPVVAIVPIGGLVFAETLNNFRINRTFLIFLIISPVIFECFGGGKIIYQ